MKLKYNLFGFIPTTHEIEGYTLSIASQTEDAMFGSQAWDVAATYWGARFKAWRLARKYAHMEQLDQHIFIYRGTGEFDTRPPICCRTLRVFKVTSVSIFTN